MPEEIARVVTVLYNDDFGVVVTDYDTFEWMWSYDPDFDDYETVASAPVGTTIELDLYEGGPK